MSAYLIFDVDIHDMDTYRVFMERVKPVVESYGGRYLVRGGRHEVLEGSWDPARLVLFEFPDVEAAKALFASNDYAPLKELRRSCSTGNVVVVEGL